MNNLKKIVSINLILFIIFLNINNLRVYAKDKYINLENIEIKEIDEDKQAIVVDINSLNVDKKEVYLDEKIKISIRITDDISELSYVDLFYRMPITESLECIHMNYNIITDMYEGEIKINENSEAGIWQIKWIQAGDTCGNSISIENGNIYGATDPNLSQGDFKVIGTLEDIEAPILDAKSLKVDKKLVSSGEKIQVSLRITDDISGVQNVYVQYLTPITKKMENIMMTYNNNLKLYTCDIYIGNGKESGIWEIDNFMLVDKMGNERRVFNNIIYNNILNGEDLSSGNFEVIGTNADIKPPILDLESLNIDKKEVKPGDTLKISVKVNDDLSGVKNIYMWYKTPITKNIEIITMNYNSILDIYEGKIDIDRSSEAGLWIINSFFLIDKAGNYTYIFNNNINGYEVDNMDLSMGNFNIQADGNEVKSLEDTEVVNKNEQWTINRVINGDLYIGPNISLIIKGNLIVTGNIYVVGSLKTYGELTVNGSLYCTSLLSNNFKLQNGSVDIRGINNINNINISNSSIKNIPLRIDTSILISKGVLNLRGATVDIADLYIEDKKISLDYKGTFDLKDIYIGDKKTIKIKFITIFNDEIIKEFKVFEKEDINNDDKIDILDLAKVAQNYNKNNYDKGWNFNLDINKDNIIDIFDLILISKKL